MIKYNVQSIKGIIYGYVETLKWGDYKSEW